MAGEGGRGAAHGGGDNNWLDRVANMGYAVGKRIVKDEIRDASMDIFADHGKRDLQEFIATDYPLVENDLPDYAKGALYQYGPRYANEIEEHITPDRILHWLEHPEEWMDVEAAPEQAERMQECAATIREMEGGYEWLERRVLRIYELAGIVPEKPNRPPE